MSNLGAALLASLLLLPSPIRAQRVQALPALGGDADERARLAQLAGDSTDNYLLRTTGSRLSLHAAGFAWLAPELLLVSNSALPHTLNDGALWAGRGTSVRLRGGGRFAWRGLAVVLAPEYVRSQNRRFPLPDTTIAPPLPPERDSFANPWHVRPGSIDLPLRMGPRGLSQVLPGQSSITLAGPVLAAGLATDDAWWGPGVRNAIVLSSNAAGVPRFFLRTARPLRTGAGRFEGMLFTGGLTESAFFDTTTANDLRSVSGLAATWVPAGAPGLTVGVARTVYRPVDGWTDVPLRLFDALTSWRRPNDRPPADSSQTPGPDQVVALFARYVLPAAGVEAWLEVARSELPRSLRDFLESPDHSRGYTMGLQWSRAAARGARVRVQAEITSLERSASFRSRPTTTWYTSRAVLQGYTQRGQPLGAAIGPGSSSQWLAADWFAPSWRAGLFVERIRWDNDAWYDHGPGPALTQYCGNDVSVTLGGRGGWGGRWGRALLTAAAGWRYNAFLEQRQANCLTVFDNRGKLDRNVQLTLTVTPGR